MKKPVKILIGLAALFAAGAAVGALYAPDEGGRTRRRMARSGRWLFHTATDRIGEGKDKLESLRDKMKDELEKVNDEIERIGRSQKCS